MRKETEGHDGMEKRQGPVASAILLDGASKYDTAAGEGAAMGSDPVMCGSHTSNLCSNCTFGSNPPDPTYCNGDCQWNNASSVCEVRPTVNVASLSAFAVNWGGSTFAPKADYCIEHGLNGEQIPSDFSVFNGQVSNLNLEAGTTQDGGTPTEQSAGGLKIYKTACPNSTA